MEVVLVLDVDGQTALVRLPDTSEEPWSLASLPRGVQTGDRVGVMVAGGGLEMVLLPRLSGLRACAQQPAQGPWSGSASKHPGQFSSQGGQGSCSTAAGTGRVASGAPLSVWIMPAVYSRPASTRRALPQRQR